MTTGPDSLKEAYRLLDIDPGATPEELKQAYHRMKALYSEGSLATYSLLTEEERADMLSDIEKAYLAITVSIREESAASAPAPTLSHVTGPAPAMEPEEEIGQYLRSRREESGLPIKELANMTRIRSTHLENIELERFDLLPAPVYLRGFIIEYARSLQLPDPEGLAAIYIDRYRESHSK